MAPEIIERKPYDGTAVDVFAAAVTLFIMYSWSFPFENAKKEDMYYKYMCNNKF